MVAYHELLQLLAARQQRAPRGGAAQHLPLAQALRSFVHEARLSPHFALADLTPTVSRSISAGRPCGTSVPRAARSGGSRPPCCPVLCAPQLAVADLLEGAVGQQLSTLDLLTFCCSPTDVTQPALGEAAVSCCSVLQVAQCAVWLISSPPATDLLRARSGGAPALHGAVRGGRARAPGRRAGAQPKHASGGGRGGAGGAAPSSPSPSPQRATPPPTPLGPWAAARPTQRCSARPGRPPQRGERA